jgi:PPOX class probable F420-dependent enzyme
MLRRMDATSLAAARIVRFLEREPIIWLSSVRPDGNPHLVPIWFSWDGEAVLIFSKPDAQKVRNLRARAAVMLALGDAEADFDIGLLHGTAELLDVPTRDVITSEHLAKYATRMAAIGLDAETYAATYSQVIRIVPDEYLGWHGRTTPPSERAAGARAASIVEPRRPELDGSGEPVGRWLRRPLGRVVAGLGLGGGLGTAAAGAA